MFDSAIQAPLTEAFSGRQYVRDFATIASSYEAGPDEPDALAHPAPRRAMQVSNAEFKALYEAHCQLVWRALSRLGVPDADVMDLTQKVFLVAYLKLPEFEGRSQVSTWLWGICRRVAIAFRRSGAVRHEVITDPSALEASTERFSAGSDELDTTRQVALERVLSKLSEPQRVVFTLFEVEGLRGAEIAGQLKVSLGTVRSRLRYARQVLRREVQRLRLCGARAGTSERLHRIGAPARRALEKR